MKSLINIRGQGVDGDVRDRTCPRLFDPLSIPFQNTSTFSSTSCSISGSATPGCVAKRVGCEPNRESKVSTSATAFAGTREPSAEGKPRVWFGEEEWMSDGKGGKR